MKKLVTGRAGFVDDVAPDGLLHAAIAVSPHPHARVTAIDAAAARSLPGVVAVLTHEADDLPPLFSGIATFAGAPVAAVAAEDPEIAWRAADLLRGTYDTLPAIAWTPDLAEREPPVATVLVETGTPGPAMDPGRVVEVVRRGDRSYPLPAEPPAAVTWLDEDGQLVVRSATASPLRLRLALADALGLSGGRIRIERPEVGGDFGAREGIFLEVACASFTRRTGRPVRMALRPRDPAGAVSRGAWWASARGSLREGRLETVELTLALEGGASPRVEEVEAEMRRAAAALQVYGFAATRFVGRAFAIHAPPASGSAGLAVGVTLEALVDEAANAVGEDPLSFRERHASEGAGGRGVRGLLGLARRQAAWSRRSRTTAGADVWGAALARMPLRPGSAHAALACNEDGSYTVSWSACEHGTALAPVVEKIVAERLGVPAERVSSTHGSPTDSPPSTVADPWLVMRAVLEATGEMVRKRRRGPAMPHGLVTRAEARAEDAPVPLGAFLALVGVDFETGLVELRGLVQAIGAAGDDPSLLARAEGDAWRAAGLALFEGPGDTPAQARLGDLPAPVTILGPRGRKGASGQAPLGEVAFVGVTAAIANAVATASGGAAVHLPFTPERVFEAWRRQGSRS